MGKNAEYERLANNLKNGWLRDGVDKDKIFGFCEGYKSFLDAAKTEREAVCQAVAIAKKHGFVPLEEKKSLTPGDKVYVINRLKTVMLCVIGKQPLDAGVNIVGAHIDAPRIDLKQNPLYEEGGMGFLKTHYYGGIKKYQWTAMPLAIHGVVIKCDGSKVEIKIGEDQSEPVFCITDLLPHLGQDQMQKKMAEGITGEGLNILIGSIPKNADDVEDKIKFNILSIINEKYGITEADFLSAEIEIVPAHMARDIGFDRSMVGAYGQDDRVCSYTALMAAMDIATPQKTAVCLLCDKEEIGSMGNTGAKSKFFVHVIEDMCELTGSRPSMVIRNSQCLSADVGAAFDPNYPDVYEKRNSAYINKGVQLVKYTGSRGKAGSNDASAEFVGKVRTIFEKTGVIWQTGELGKVDHGGGGTIAQFMANLNMDVIDCGVPVLSMHSPCEVTGKLDIYMAYKGYLEFFNLA